MSTRNSLLLHFFPPPVYMAMPTIGLDLSDRSVKYVELSRTRAGLKLERFGEYLIPEGVVESGDIKDAEALKNVFSLIKKEINISYAAVSLPEEKAYLVPLKIPTVPMRELRGSIEFQIEAHVPIPVAESVFDYALETDKRKEKEYSVSVSVMPRSVVEGYLDIFRKAGIEPLSFEIEAHAIARAVIPQGDLGTHMIIDFGRTRTSFIIVSKGIAWFSSTVAIGGDAITEAIEKKAGLPHAAATHLKETKGLSRSPENKDLFLTLTPIISVLRDEVSKHYLYWNTHKDESGIARQKIETIVMCGGDANIPGLLEYLSAGLDVPVEFANPWHNIIPSFDEEIPGMTFNHSLRYAPALGLALRKLL